MLLVLMSPWPTCRQALDMGRVAGVLSVKRVRTGFFLFIASLA